MIQFLSFALPGLASVALISSIVMVVRREVAARRSRARLVDALKQIAASADTLSHFPANQASVVVHGHELLRRVTLPSIERKPVLQVQIQADDASVWPRVQRATPFRLDLTSNWLFSVNEVILKSSIVHDEKGYLLARHCWPEVGQEKTFAAKWVFDVNTEYLVLDRALHSASDVAVRTWALGRARVPVSR